MESLTPAQLEVRSLCGEWTVREVAAHLLVAARPGSGLAALGVLVRSGFRLHKANAAMAKSLAARGADIPAGLRANAENPFKPPVVGYLGQLTDLQVHGQDIRRPLGLPRDLEPDRLRASLDFLTAGRAVGFTRRDRLAGLRLETTDIAWDWGSGVVVAGPAEALMMAICGRRSALADLDGPGVAVLAARA